MSTSRHTATPASYVIFRKEGKILLMRRKGSGYYDGWYAVPAGHVEPGELPGDCAVREIKEEVGVDLDKRNLRLVHTMYRTRSDETGDRVDYFFAADDWSGDPVNCESHKCDDLQWFSREKLPEAVVHYVRAALEAIENGFVYSEWSLDDIKQQTAE